MLDVSARWRDSVGRVARWGARVSWTSDGKSWHSCTPIACTVSEDATQQVRWNTNVTLRAADVQGLSVFGSRLRVFCQMVHGSDWIEEIQLGDYRVDTVKTPWQPTSPGEALVEITASSWEQQLIDARLLVPRQVSGNAFTVLKELVGEVIGGREFVWLSRTNSNAHIPSVVVDRDRWGFIDGNVSSGPSWAKTLGVMVYADNLGRFVVADPPSLDGKACWRVAGGDGGAQLSAAASLDRAGVRNVVVATGSTTDDSKPSLGPYIVKDTNSWSSTNVNIPVAAGGFGQVPIFYTSSMFTSVEQVANAAKAMLAPRLGVTRTLDMGLAFDPAKRAGDVGIVHTPGGPQKVLLDSVECDLVAATMTCGTRATTTTGDFSADNADIQIQGNPS